MVRVDTWFREVFSALPVIDRICETTTVRNVMGGAARDRNDNPLRPDQAAVEAQRLLDLRFIGEAPGDPGTIRVTPSESCWK